MTESQTAAATIIDPELKGYVEYEIDIEKVLRNELPEVVAGIELAPLTAASVIAIPEGAKGAYVLFVGVYQRHNYFDEKRLALAAWGREVKRLARPVPTASKAASGRRGRAQRGSSITSRRHAGAAAEVSQRKGRGSAA